MIPTKEATMQATTYDLRFAALSGLPDTVSSKLASKRTVTPVRQLPESWNVQTIRQRLDDGEVVRSNDTVFVEYTGPDGTMRIALPHVVIELIIRQRDGLTGTLRKKAAKAEALRRKAAGIQPGFMNGRKKK